MSVLRGTVDVGGRTVGYRRAGSGPPVLLVGSPAHSSAPAVPLLRALAATHTVLAVDPPGHGFSDPVEGGVPGAALDLADTLTALGVGPAAVVGRHLGGAVALELTLRDPERFPLLVLDDVPLLDAEGRAAWLAATTTIPVRDDGSHLLQHWYRRRRAFVHGPWWDTASALDLDLTDPEVLDLEIHAAVLDQVDAGEAHADGDRLALGHDTVAALRATTVAVLALESSYAALGAAADLRPDVTTVPCAPDLAARRSALVGALADWCGEPAPQVAPTVPAVGRWTVQVPETPWGQVAVRRFRSGTDDRPLVLLHASPLSGESLLPLARELARRRDVLVLDTLGNGDSDAPGPELAGAGIADLAQVALAAVAALGVEDFDVFGTHTGAMIGLEMGIAAPERIGALLLDGLPLLDTDGPAALPADFHVDLAPRWDGTHLATAWSNAVDVLTWYPWNQRDPTHRRPLAQPPTAALHRRVVQLLRGGTSYIVSSTAVVRHRTTERLPLLRVPTSFCRAPADPMAVYVERCVAGVLGATVLDLTTDVAVDAGRIADRLDAAARTREPA